MRITISSETLRRYVLLDDTLLVFLHPEVLVQLQVIVEHFLGRAVTQVLHTDPPSNL
jgi:hypothetical protein